MVVASMRDCHPASYYFQSLYPIALLRGNAAPASLLAQLARNH